jgi:hypothetical protein
LLEGTEKCWRESRGGKVLWGKWKRTNLAIVAEGALRFLV